MPATPENLQVAAPQQAQPQADAFDTLKSNQQGKPGGQLHVLEIIRRSFNREKTTKDTFEVFVKKLATKLKDPNNKLAQFGNTVFLLQKIGPTSVELHTFSADTAANLIRNFTGAAKLLKNQGIKKVTTYADSPGYLEIAKKTGLPVKVAQSAKVISGKAQPVYTFELEL
jgi:hypothetical protein